MKKKKICLLVDTVSDFKFRNFLILANALLKKKNCEVYLCLIDTLSLNSGEAFGKVLKINNSINVGDTFEEELFEFVNLAHYMDYVWVLSFGKRLSFLDHMEILWILKHNAKIINSIESLVFIGNKYCLNLFLNIFQSPITYASCDFDYLWDIYTRHKQKIWVLKPPAESMGRNVFLLKPNDTNVRAIIQSMTDEKTGKFCIMQECLHEIKNGEKRVLVANGKVICFYLRIIKDNSDHRTNLHQGAQAEICALTKDEDELCKKIGAYFLKMGICFIGIDLVFPYVIEINIVNPGGLNTIYDLTKIDYSKNVVDEIFG